MNSSNTEQWPSRDDPYEPPTDDRGFPMPSPGQLWRRFLPYGKVGAIVRVEACDDTTVQVRHLTTRHLAIDTVKIPFPQRAVRRFSRQRFLLEWKPTGEVDEQSRTL